jgi:hypothetical protein
MWHTEKTLLGSALEGQADCEVPAFYRKYIMADDDRTRARTADKTAGPRKKSSEERPFDLWLHKQLHAMYDEIASEPLPDELVGLITRDAGASGDAAPNPPREPRNKK